MLADMRWQFASMLADIGFVEGVLQHGWQHILVLLADPVQAGLCQHPLTGLCSQAIRVSPTRLGAARQACASHFCLRPAPQALAAAGAVPGWTTGGPATTATQHTQVGQPLPLSLPPYLPTLDRTPTTVSQALAVQHTLPRCALPRAPPLTHGRKPLCLQRWSRPSCWPPCTPTWPSWTTRRRQVRALLARVPGGTSCPRANGSRGRGRQDHACWQMRCRSADNCPPDPPTA